MSVPESSHREEGPTLAREVEEMLSKGISPEDLAGIEDGALQGLLALAVKSYVARLEGGDHLPPFQQDSGVTATEVVAAISEMLDFADVEVFELGMWRSWGRV